MEKLVENEGIKANIEKLQQVLNTLAIIPVENSYFDEAILKAIRNTAEVQSFLDGMS